MLGLVEKVHEEMIDEERRIKVEMLGFFCRLLPKKREADKASFFNGVGGNYV